MLDKVKKPAKAENAKFSLHVSLLMQVHGLAKADATWLAWVEGPKGLEKLLAKLAEKETEAEKGKV